MKPASFLFLSSLVVSSAALALACSGDGGPGSGDPGRPGELIDNGFESDDPRPQENASAGLAESSSADAGTAAAAPSDTSAGAGAQRAIEEADIVKLDGTRLYALSRYGGLSVIDASNPDALRLVGRKRTDGQPFEMYVRDGRVHVMLNDFGRYVRTADSPYGSWQQSSEIVVLDVQNPANITEVTHYDVPGSIADSRLVGDVLYLVTYESGRCWGCQSTDATVITSFNVAGPTVNKVDTLTFGGGNTYSWKRSVSATNQRLYVAGPEYNWQPGGGGQASSLIQVVDITDPAGSLKKGADVAIAGQINSRWQMDEHAGVLRVVSQFSNGWGGSTGSINPKVQTFTVSSATSITPLGSTELVMPEPESLQSVRFDGHRGYAITSRRTDPLFTIDLANPAAPKQAGELAMPGWIFHMEPRGDRLVGFGYDENNKLAVSLFDVADMTKPTMISRVAFGNGWGQVAEDQDRIHKSVRVLDEQGLVLVPFASYGRWEGSGCNQPQSGIQLIDYGRDALTLRGIAPQHGMPRRAMITGGRLLAVSDRNVTSFDIASRDNPVKKHELDLSNPSYRTAALPNHLASLTNDWWTGAASLSLTPKEGADDANIAGRLSLESLAPSNDQSYCGGPSVWTSWYQARIFTHGDFVYLTVPVYSYDYASSSGKRRGKVIVAAIDATNPASPVIVGKSEMTLTTRDSKYGYWGGYGFWDGYGYYSYYGNSVVGAGDGVVRVGTKLAYLEIDQEYVPRPASPLNGVRYDIKLHRKLHTVDFENPTAPVVSPAIDLGDSLGSTPLHRDGDVVMTSRWVASKNPGKVRFFADRVHLGGPSPIQMSSINTPGSLLSIDAATHRMVTTDYKVARKQAADWQDCQTALGRHAIFDYQTKQCFDVTRSFKLSDVSGTKVTLKSTLTPPSQNIAGVVTSEDRVYVSRYADYEYSSCSGNGACLPVVREQGGLWAIGGIKSGQLSIVSSLDGDARWPLAAHGTKVALYTDAGLAIYDTATSTPSLVSDATLRGYGYGSHVLMDEHKAVCSLGEWGLQTVTY